MNDFKTNCDVTIVVLPSSNIYQIRSQLPLAAYLQVAFKFWKKLVPWAFPKFEKLVIRTFLWTKPMKARAKIYRLQFVSNKFLKCLSPFWPSFLTPVSCFTGISDTFRQFETGKSSSYFLKGISEEHWSLKLCFSKIQFRQFRLKFMNCWNTSRSNHSTKWQQSLAFRQMRF